MSLFLVLVLLLCLVAADLDRRWPRPPALLTAFVVFVAVSASADEPVPTPSPLRWRLESWTQVLVKPGADRKPLFGARLAADYAAPYGVHAIARIDASALGDGGAVNVRLDDPTTFSTVEAYAGAYRNVHGPLAVTAVYGIALPIENGAVKPLDRYPETLGAGVLVGDGTGDRWLLVMVGRHDAAGRGAKLLVTSQLALVGITSFVGDAAIGGAGSFARFGVAVKVKQ